MRQDRLNCIQGSPRRCARGRRGRKVVRSGGHERRLLCEALEDRRLLSLTFASPDTKDGPGAPYYDFVVQPQSEAAGQSTATALSAAVLGGGFGEPAMSQATLAIEPVIAARLPGSSLPDDPARVVSALDAELAPPASQPIDPQAWQTIHTQTFEGAFPSAGWTVSGSPSWDDTSYSAHGGSWSAYCVDTTVPAPGPYPNNTNAWMVYGPFSLADATDAKVDFWYRNKSELNYDNFIWAASTNGTNFYGYQTSGDRNTWRSASFDLKTVPTLGNLSGQSQVWIAFIFISDFSNTDVGAFVDDVVISKDVAGGTDLASVDVYAASAADLATPLTTITVGQSVELVHKFTYSGPTPSASHTERLQLDANTPVDWTGTLGTAGTWYYHTSWTATAGDHRLRGWLDLNNNIAESNEANNFLDENPSFTVGAAWQTVFSDGFEGAFPGTNWTLYGNPTWGDESYTAHTGSWSAYCVGSSIIPPGPYSNGVDAWMVYGPFSLANATDAKVDFWYRNKSEQNFDYFRWMASVDNSSYYGYQVTGDQNSWRSQAFDLKTVPTLGNLSGQSQVWIAFSFASDSSITDLGAFVDDVVISKRASGVTDLASVDVYAASAADLATPLSTITEGQSVELVHKFTYLGPEPSASHTERLQLDANTAVDWTGTLSPSGTWYYHYTWTATAGAHRLRGWLDLNNTMVESDETNNTRDENPSFDVQPPQLGEIRGFKWNDLDGDRLWDQPGEPGLAGWRIYLDANSNGAWNTGEPYAWTGADGSYALTGLAAGTYLVAEEHQAGWGQTFPNPGPGPAPPATGGAISAYGPSQGVTAAASTAIPSGEVSFGGIRDRSADLPVDLDNYLVNDSGRVISIDPPPDPSLLPPRAAGGDLVVASPYPLPDTFLLHSNPGASKVIYLDFDGHVTTGTFWNSDFGVDPIITPAYSFEGGSSFSDAEKERIQQIWERVAEDYMPFDVDVTTQDPGVEALRNTGGGDTHWGVRVVIGGDGAWTGGAYGGIAYLNSFTWDSDTPCFAFEENLADGEEKATAEASSHEAGHTVGLYHDGTSSVGYYEGHGSGATGWAPIMGVGYYRELVQWSKGEYPGANNPEDDLTIITTGNGFGYRTDDHGNTAAGASALGVTGGTAVSDTGLIERTTDVDYFAFTTAAGTISLNVDPFYRSPNLDVLAKLYNSLGVEIASSNPTSLLDASFNLALAAGTYYVSVEGVGKPAVAGDPGYTDYGSLGYYTITGTIFNAAPPGTHTVVLAPGEIKSSINFGNRSLAPAEIHGSVFNDVDGDGQQDVGETGLSGWTVYLDLNNDRQRDPGEPWTTSGPAGDYAFLNLAPGTYTVAQEVQSFWTQTLPDPTVRPASAAAAPGTGASAVTITTEGSTAPAYPLGQSVETAALDPQGFAGATTPGNSLIGLDAFRSDPRFAGITGAGYAAVVLDTGIDLNHPFFGPDADLNGVADRIVYQYDFADLDADASDVNGHGSNVASIVASQDATYQGMAPAADVIALKVFQNSGSGTFGYVESALQWVAANAAAYHIASVNMSLSDSGNYTTPQTLYGISDELAALAAAGVIVVSASGNSFYNFGSAQGVGYPSADPNSLSIGAVYTGSFGGFSYGSGAIAYTTGADRIAPFSQRHATLTTVFAPGAPITGANQSGGLVTMHGTSQASPHVAGIAVLAQQLAQRELGRRLTLAELTSLVRSSAVTIHDGDDEDDNVVHTSLDFPRVNVLALGEAILGMSGPGPGTYKAVLAPGQSLTGLKFGNWHQTDYGDAPDTYATTLAADGARHALTANGPRLGALIDAETNGQPNATATGDDTSGLDDEDGVVFATALKCGRTAQVQVDMTTSPAAGVLSAWVDLNRDGDFADAGEKVLSDVSLAAGSVHTLSFPVPGTAEVGGSFARFRVSSAAGLSYSGPADDGEVEDYAVTISSDVPDGGRHVFYNRSKFDGNDPAANAADDAAIAPDKQALLPGQTAVLANYTSYSRGINGIMVDVLGLPVSTLDATDFEFKYGNNNSPAGWTTAPDPVTVAVRPGAGVGGSDRVTLVWADNAIPDANWLRVAVKANARTGLATPDVLYFGCAIGDTGNSTLNAIVNSSDVTRIRNNYTAFGSAPIDSLFDLNRDGKVNSSDVTICRTHFSGFTPLKLIAVPAGSAPAGVPTPLVSGSAVRAPAPDALYDTVFASNGVIGSTRDWLLDLAWLDHVQPSKPKPDSSAPAARAAVDWVLMSL